MTKTNKNATLVSTPARTGNTSKVTQNQVKLNQVKLTQARAASVTKVTTNSAPVAKPVSRVVTKAQATKVAANRAPVSRVVTKAAKVPTTTQKTLAKDSVYALSKPARAELAKILSYNDSCKDLSLRVTREAAISLLESYGWSGSVYSLTRLLKANFGRTLTSK